MENQYLVEAWNNRPDHRVYGFRLKPFCLNYLHLLQSINSPLLTQNKPFHAKDLFLASEICCFKWSEEGYTLDRLLQPSQFRRRRNQLRLLTEPFKKQVEGWREYYADFLVVAKKWEDTGETYDQWGNLVSVKRTKGRTDLEKTLSTATVIIGATGWSEKKVMMMPIGRAYAWADYFAIREGDQKIKFLTMKEEAMQERDRLEQERLKAEAK